MRKPAYSKKKAVVDRINGLAKAIAEARDYLESGKPENWQGSRALFDPKVRDGKILPPHRDWVKNFVLPRMEQALARAERVLEKVDQSEVRRV